jgi:preprotein translocase subunit SecA
MGFWDWLRGKTAALQISDDSVWLTTEAKLLGVCNAVSKNLDAGRSVLVVAHFPATLAILAEEMHKQNTKSVSLSEVTTKALSAHLRNEPHVMSALAASLVPDSFPVLSDDAPGEPKLAIIAAERHFVRARDDHVVAFAEGLSIPCQLGFHLSLEDPLLRKLGLEWTAGALRGLGMTEANAVQSRGLSRGIKGAQAKLLEFTTGEQPARSAEEWLRLNSTDRA